MEILELVPSKNAEPLFPTLGNFIRTLPTAWTASHMCQKPGPTATVNVRLARSIDAKCKPRATSHKGNPFATIAVTKGIPPSYRRTIQCRNLIDYISDSLQRKLSEISLTRFLSHRSILLPRTICLVTKKAVLVKLQ